MEINYTPTPTGNAAQDKNNQDIATIINAILIAIKELQEKAGI